MNKGKKIILIMVVCIVTLMFLRVPTFAEVGNTGGFDSDSDSGSSSGYSSGSSDGYSSSGEFNGWTVVIFAGVIVFIIIGHSGSKKQNQNNIRSRFNTTFFDEESVVRIIKEIDKNFSTGKFKSYVGELYITLQEAWQAKNWKGIRVFETDELFNMHNRQLQEYIDRNITNYLNMQDVRDVTIASFNIDGNQEVLVVRLNACCIDYTADDKTKKIISGSKTILQERSYRLEFVRNAGLKTEVGDNLIPTNCPNCGAPIEMTVNGECEYCHTIITNAKYGWRLNKYSSW